MRRLGLLRVVCGAALVHALGFTLSATVGLVAQTGASEAAEQYCCPAGYRLSPPNYCVRVVSTGGGGTTAPPGGSTASGLGIPAAPAASVVEQQPATLCSQNSRGTGGNISAKTGLASVVITREFTEILSDHNEDLVSGDGSVGESAGVPAAAIAYAPSEFQAVSPIMVKAPPPPAYKVFATGFGGGFSASGGQTGSYYGGLAGIDYKVLPNLIVGLAAGGSGTSTSVNPANASGSTSGFNGSVYAIGTRGAFYAQTLTTFSSFENQTTRNVAAGGGNPAAVQQASFGSTEIRERLEFGRVYTSADLPALGSFKVVPFVALEIANLHLDGHSESNINGVGNFAGLRTQGQDISDIPAFIGARFERSMPLSNGMVLTPIVRVAYVHQFASAIATQNVALGTGASVFAANTTLLGRNAAQTKAGAELSIGHNTVIFANFDGLFSGESSIYGGRGGIRYSW